MNYKEMSCLAIHDISGVGKCSLTVALPVLSCCGVETSVLPTAVLSTHTGGFTGFTYRDLTDDLLPMAEPLEAGWAAGSSPCTAAFWAAPGKSAWWRRCSTGSGGRTPSLWWTR